MSTNDPVVALVEVATTIGTNSIQIPCDDNAFGRDIDVRTILRTYVWFVGDCIGQSWVEHNSCAIIDDVSSIIKTFILFIICY